MPKNVLIFFSISGRQVPWGSTEWKEELTNFMAGHRWYRPGPHFLILAPDGVCNPNAVRWCQQPFAGYDQAPIEPRSLLRCAGEAFVARRGAQTAMPLKAWTGRGLCCRNALIVDSRPTLGACIGPSAVAHLLGAGAPAKNA